MKADQKSGVSAIQPSCSALDHQAIWHRWLEELKNGQLWLSGNYAIAGCNKIIYNTSTGKFHFEAGDDNYGPKDVRRDTGLIQIQIPKTKMLSLLSQAGKTGTGEVQFKSKIHDMLTAPSQPNHLPFRCNNRRYRGSVVLRLTIEKKRLVFSIHLSDHESHPWKGY